MAVLELENVNCNAKKIFYKTYTHFIF